MRKTVLLTLACLACGGATIQAAHAQVSPDGRKMMKLASIGVGILDEAVAE